MTHDGDGHRKRLRERYLHDGGLDSFQDHEVLEFALTLFLPRIDTKPIAKALLRQFGSVYRVLEASPEELHKVKGIGEVTAFALSALPHIMRRYERDRVQERPDLMRRGDMGEFCRSLFVGERYEVSRLILLNNQGRFLHEETISRGTVDQVSIYARNVIELALRHGAKYAAIAHNHPGGTREPSPGDIEVTTIIKRAFDAIDVVLIDHIIVTGDGFVSVRDYATGQVERIEAFLSAGDSMTRKLPVKPYAEGTQKAAEKTKADRSSK